MRKLIIPFFIIESMSYLTRDELFAGNKVGHHTNTEPITAFKVVRCRYYDTPEDEEYEQFNTEYGIAELEIPKNSKIIRPRYYDTFADESIVSESIRSNQVYVKSIPKNRNYYDCSSLRDETFKYTLNTLIKPDYFCSNEYNREVSSIHSYLKKEDAQFLANVQPNKKITYPTMEERNRYCNYQ